MSLNNDSAEAQHLKIKAVLKSELHIHETSIENTISICCDFASSQSQSGSSISRTDNRNALDMLEPLCDWEDAKSQHIEIVFSILVS
jgi:hypothetical protein